MVQAIGPTNRQRQWGRVLGRFLLSVLLTGCTPLIQPPMAASREALLPPAENPAVLQTRQVLTQQLHTDLAAVAIGDVIVTQWPDACLGAPRPNERCAQTQTPGYRITLTVNDQLYLYHTNQDGSEQRLVTAPAPAIGDRILTWSQRDESGCQTLEAGADGVAFGPCGGRLLGVPYRVDTRQPDLTWFAGHYQSFTAETSAGAVDFVGYGATVATTAEQRMIAEWARLVALEAQGGPSGASWGLIFAWRREGGTAGLCEDVTVYVTGDAYITSCQGGQPAELARIRLEADQLATVYGWVDTLQSFETEPHDAAATEAVTSRLLFSGAGAQVASESEQQAIAAFAQQLHEQATPVTAPAVAPLEFTYRSAEGGFTLRYPATVTQMSHVHPTIEGVLAPAANTAAFVSNAPRYVLSLTWFDLADRTVLRRFTDANLDCPAGVDTAGQPFDLAGQAALLFPDTRCGPFGTTYLFTVVDLRGYRITIESSEMYGDVQSAVETLLATLHFQPPRLASDLPAPDAGEALIESLAVRVLETDPVQVEVLIRGQLPDACAFIETTAVVREGNTYHLRLTTARQPNQRCAPQLTPFEQVAPLDSPAPAPGTYTVQIDDLVAPFTVGDALN